MAAPIIDKSGTQWRNRVVLFCAVLVVASHTSRLAAAEMTEAEIRALTEGTYVLESWVVEGQQVGPPSADGRFSLHDGVLMLMARSQVGDKTRAIYGFGRYLLTRAMFSYGYLSFSDIKAAGKGTEISYDLPFQSMRMFKLRTKPGEIIGDYGTAQLIFEREGLTYLEDLKTVRKWKRISE